MTDLKRFLDEGMTPIDDALEKITGKSLGDVPTGLSAALHQNDQTTVNLEDVTLNTVSVPTISEEKSEFLSDVSLTASVTVNLKRAPANVNSDPEYRVMLEATSVNT